MSNNFTRTKPSKALRARKLLSTILRAKEANSTYSTIAESHSFEEATMPELLFTCNDRLCHDPLDLHGLDLYGLGEVIEHLRSKHLSFIRRPNALGFSDSHGHVWYCFHCESKTGNDHRSFQSDKAMWDHLNDRHDHQLDGIKLER